MSDKQRQTDEIEVLESIYDTDLIIFSKWPCSGCLRISPDPMNDEIDMNVVNVVNGQSVGKTIKLKYLAPIEMYFKCPMDYPSKSQPLFMLKCIWLSEETLSSICRNFDKIWDSTRSEILYDWAYSLKDCCSVLKIERLNFEVIVNESSVYPSELHLEQKTDLRLKVLRNKILESKNQRESNNKKKTKFRREHKLRGNFKYETPKEKIETLMNVNDDPQIEKGINFCCTLIWFYGNMWSTVNLECDVRSTPEL